MAEFRLEDVHHGPAFFDVKKLTHLNGEYIRELSPGGFEAAVKPWVQPDPSGSAWSPPADQVPWPPERFDEQRFEAIAPLVQERVAVLGEVPAMIDFLFLEEPAIDEKSWAKVARDPSAPTILSEAIAAYGDCHWDRDTLYAVTQAVAESVGVKLNKVDTPLRVAVTGRTVGPPLFEPLEILGRDEVLARLGRSLERLTAG
jgi:glutamyl-tRNA synthetase